MNESAAVFMALQVALRIAKIRLTSKCMYACSYRLAFPFAWLTDWTCSYIMLKAESCKKAAFLQQQQQQQQQNIYVYIYIYICMYVA